MAGPKFEEASAAAAAKIGSKLSSFPALGEEVATSFCKMLEDSAMYESHRQQCVLAIHEKVQVATASSLELMPPPDDSAKQFNAFFIEYIQEGQNDSSMLARVDLHTHVSDFWQCCAAGWVPTTLTTIRNA